MLMNPMVESESVKTITLKKNKQKGIQWTQKTNTDTQNGHVLKGDEGSYFCRKQSTQWVYWGYFTLAYRPAL